MSGPRVVMLAPNFPPADGGVERLAAGLAAHLWPATTVVVAPPAPGGEAWDATAPFRVLRRPLTRRLPPRWLPARAAARAEGKADVVVALEWWPAARALPRRTNNGPLRVTFVYGTDVTGATAGGARRSLRAAMAATDRVVAISAYTAAALADALGGTTPPVDIVHPGVELDPPGADPAAVRAHLGLGRRPVVLTTARLVERKGHADFLAAWPAVLARHPDAVWLVAGDGPCRERLAAAAPASVRLLGRVDDVTLHGLYRAADVHVLPGRPHAHHVEGFGMAAVEAGAAGTPTVATALGGTPEAVGAGGVVVPVGDGEALAAAVADLLGDDTGRAALGAAARARAEELSWDRVAARVRAVLSDATAGQRPLRPAEVLP